MVTTCRGGPASTGSCSGGDRSQKGHPGSVSLRAGSRVKRKVSRPCRTTTIITVNQTRGRPIRLLDDLRTAYDIPVQSCVLTHVTTTLGLMDAGVPVDLVFQSIAGTQGANSAFGVTLPMLAEAAAAGRELGRGTVGDNVMYFETGQGTPLSSGTHLGAGGRPVDQQTLECRAYAVTRAFDPLLVNTVVGFIGPEYLYDGKQIIRAGLEDNFCGKLLGLPMGVDVCTPTTPRPTRTTWTTFWACSPRPGPPSSSRSPAVTT